MRTHVLIDDMPNLNRLRCACGAEIHPACDVSLASINEAFEAHLAGVDPSELDDWQRSILPTADHTEDT